MAGMRLLELPAVLRGAGLIVHEFPGWRERGDDTNGSFGPVVGIICHGTGGSLTSTDSGELNVIAITGSNTAPEVPIAQLYQSRTGQWWVVASGRATGVKTGTAGPMKGLSDDAVLQIEAQHNGAEPWTPTQYWSYVRGVAALVRYLKIAVSMVAGHAEHQPGEKTDPWFDMNQFRRDVEFVLRGDADMLFMKVKGNTKTYIKEGDGYRWLTTGPNNPTAGNALAIMQRNGYRVVEFDTMEELKAIGGRDLDAETPAPGDPIDQEAFARRVTAGVVEGVNMTIDGITGVQFVR